MKRRFITILFAICLVLSMSLVAACSGCSKKPPKAGEGVVYQTGAQSFWVGVGQAYMTFENVAESEQKEENTLYGKVFYVKVSSDSGKTYSPWLSGKWEMNDAKTELTLTASWESGDNSTTLVDATSGEAKKYTADGGKFTIGVNLPSAGKVNFTLDPVNDKVGEGETPTPPAECTEHVDENKDGKCDKCGKDMPNQGGDEVTVMNLLEATASGGQKAKIELKSDKSWELSVSYYDGGDYTPTASGTWALDGTTYNITLTVTGDAANVLAEDTYTLNVDYTTQKYSGTIDCALPVGGVQLSTLDFADTAITEKEGSADGTTDFFAAAVNCTVKNLTIDGARITITDYKQDTHAYVSVLASFVQGSNTLFENCTVSNATINVSCEDIWYYGVSGLFAGYWGGHANNCKFTGGSITLTAAYTKATTKPYEAIYMGGLVGEGYAWLDNCEAKTTASLVINDSRTEISAPMNVYYGGATASSTYLNKVTYEGNISLGYTKAAGAANVYYGGVSGYQRYGYINNCYSKAAMSFVNNNANAVDGQKFAAGGILGAYDTMYGLMGTAYFGIGGCRVSNCLDNSAFTVTGATVFAAGLSIIGEVPMDAVVDAYNQTFKVDMTNFKRADGSYTFFGAFN